ncbi:hypothetical protein [Cohnella hongkongensis]|uniref:Uncharacterized protein n=1 Tax=Cohnella hongkongensis TaxID=178337 RepID=A0ABV9FG92_9BACL
MDTLATIRPTGKGGGIVWPAAALVLVFLWAEPSLLLFTSVAGWLTVVSGWIARKRIRREIGTKDAIGSWLVLALLAAFVWGCAEAFVRLRQGMYHPFAAGSAAGGEWAVALGLGLLIACIGGAWLLSSAVPAASAGAGLRIHAVLVRTFGGLKRSPASGSFAAIAGSATVAAAMVGTQADAPWRIAAGLAAAYAQLCWLAAIDRDKPGKSRPAPGCEARPGKGSRRAALIALFVLHLVLFGFYILLHGALKGWSWSLASLYPFSWVGGAVWALIAWLLSLSKVAYAAAMIGIGLACALLLGAIASAYDWEVFV